MMIHSSSCNLLVLYNFRELTVYIFRLNLVENGQMNEGSKDLHASMIGEQNHG